MTEREWLEAKGRAMGGIRQYKMLKGKAVIKRSLRVLAISEDCPTKALATRIYYCVKSDYSLPICEHFIAFQVIGGKGCIKCAHPGAEDAEEFEGWLV